MELKNTKRPVRVGLISLGCAKNLVDAEIMLGSLLGAGMEITNDSKQADVVIVNTCSFIDSAQEESVDAILQSAQLREATHPDQGLIVSGCLPQRFREELPKLLPEVDVFMGIDQVAQASELVRQALAHRERRLQQPITERTAKRIVQRLQEAPQVEVHARPNYIPDYGTPRFRLTPRHFAYLKIAEGCNHPCSFCTIPRMRGSHRSRQQSDVVAEARQLIAEGVKEINLISQDTTFYGLDLRADRAGSISAPEKFRAAARALPAQAQTLCSLLRELNSIPGDFWVRILYTHPAHWTDELIQTIAECEKVARYVDMPLQHIHPVMLERMRRETSDVYIRELIARIRAGVPGIALRTTFIVGFPGETEACFETLLNFIRETKFERMGVFTYSQEEGTRAGRMENQIPDKLKRERRDRAMAAQHGIARKVSESFEGRELKVLVESAATARDLQKANIHSWEHGLIRSKDTHVKQLHGKYLIARCEADAPDIDGRVYIRGKLPIGEFARVKIIGHTDYDLIAEHG
ncbi:MAG TPA: 30S ribosomal protein S12 methylthiotransferase RimO [Verrucomicrobiae bacterium]|nr:30S ribosomal protein S12 methylthiotransferase RimO [Verrucomicrobiae bacterium]